MGAASGRPHLEGCREVVRAVTRLERMNLLKGLLFVSPWLVGFVVFLAYPMLYAGYLSFTEYTGFTAPEWIGVGNYIELFHDESFWKSLGNTLYYTALAVPLGVVVALVLAVAMNQKLREVAFYRTAIYLPSALPVFALSIIFIWLLNPRYGLFNLILGLFGVPPINWLGDPQWSKLSIVLVAQMGAGQFALIFLGGLQGIPQTLYEAVELDGATSWQKFRYITLPLISPVILYDIMVGLGLGMQVFTPALIMTNGGPLDSTLFYALYLYRNAFAYNRMGYAAAMSWLLLLLCIGIALVVFRWAQRWVHYEVGE